MADQLDETFWSSDFTACLSPTPILHETTHANGSCSVNSMDGMQTNNYMKCRSGLKRQKKDMGHRIAFRTMTELEIMDDGYKWRKYGKKRVKSSPNPRNYYKCVTGGCMVKKRVERDKEDSRYVITTYEGVHNHESPSAIYCNEMLLPRGWRMQASHCSS
ncbi:unnamed protein product [Ilex paraguariensis]|uniref:WRKY domain-containing protein n=1 Tax=Ilex paraguariensis TaxID=185542 RepID=A0ABC8TYK9_9AQUA